MYEDQDGGHEGRLVGRHLYEDLDEDDVHGVCLHVPDIDKNMKTLKSGKHSLWMLMWIVYFWGYRL